MKLNKDYLLYGIALVIFFEVALQGYELYERRIVNAPPPPISNASMGAIIDLAGSPVMGDPKAPHILIEFSDFECPYCRLHATDVMKTIRGRYVEGGELRYAFVHLPSPMHTNAEFLATASICAQSQGQFWEMHDYLFQAQPRTEGAVMSIANELGLAVDTFQTCLSDPAHSIRIGNDVAISQSLGITGTPGFALASVDESGAIEVQLMISGAQPLEVFEEAINEVRDALSE